MIAAPFQVPGAGPRGRRPFASPRMIQRLAGLLLWVGVIFAVWGVAYDINGATRAGADVQVQVQVQPGATLEVHVTNEDGARAKLQFRTEDGDLEEWLQVLVPGAAGRLAARDNTFELRAWDSTITEHLLNRGDFAIGGLCALGGALLLRPILRSLNEGEPFRRGNALRVAGISGLVLIGALAQFLPSSAANLVLNRIGQGDPGSSLAVAPVDFPLVSLIVAALLLALAEVFRRGHDLTQDIDGLV